MPLINSYLAYGWSMAGSSLTLLGTALLSAALLSAAFLGCFFGLRGNFISCQPFLGEANLGRG